MVNSETTATIQAEVNCNELVIQADIHAHGGRRIYTHADTDNRQCQPRVQTGGQTHTHTHNSRQTNSRRNTRTQRIWHTYKHDDKDRTWF